MPADQMGSTGENTLVSDEERLQVIAEVVKWTNKRVPVIAGTGSHSTEHAVQLASAAKRAGADACLVIPPYYTRPSQRGIYEHYKAVAEVGLPVMIYNNPGRAGVTVEPETITELAKLPGIVALKDATDSLDNAVRVLARCDINVISGSDNMALPLMAVGATGVMSILSNAGTVPSACVSRLGDKGHADRFFVADCVIAAAPERVLAVTRAAQRGDYKAAREAHQKNVRVPFVILQCVSPRARPNAMTCLQVLLVDSLFVEPNPQPIKKVMELLGRCSGVVRLPLTECSPETTELLKRQLQANGLLPQ